MKGGESSYHSLLSACFEERLIENKQAAMSCRKTPSLHSRISTGLEGCDCHVSMQVLPRSAGTPRAREGPPGHAVDRSTGHATGTASSPRTPAWLGARLSLTRSARSGRRAGACGRSVPATWRSVVRGRRSAATTRLARHHWEGARQRRTPARGPECGPSLPL